MMVFIPVAETIWPLFLIVVINSVFKSFIPLWMNVWILVDVCSSVQFIIWCYKNRVKCYDWLACSWSGRYEGKLCHQYKIILFLFSGRECGGVLHIESLEEICSSCGENGACSLVQCLCVLPLISCFFPLLLFEFLTRSFVRFRHQNHWSLKAHRIEEEMEIPLLHSNQLTLCGLMLDHVHSCGSL